MKPPFALLALAFVCTATAADETPKFFAGLLKKDTPIKGQIGVVVSPPEIDKYLAKVETAVRKDKQWFVEFTATTKPGLPLPYHEKLGLTKEEYAEYLKLWNQREFKPMEEVMLLLRKSSSNTWTVTATGKASTLSTLRFDPKKDVFLSPNGELKRIEDIKSDPASILGEWSGQEWKFEEKTSLGKTKENVAFGKYADGKYGLIIYRVQEMSEAGTRLLDKSLMVRFAISKTSSKE